MAFRTDLDYHEEINNETQANIFATHLMFDYEQIDCMETDNDVESMFYKLYEKYTNSYL